MRQRVAVVGGRSRNTEPRTARAWHRNQRNNALGAEERSAAIPLLREAQREPTAGASYGGPARGPSEALTSANDPHDPPWSLTQDLLAQVIGVDLRHGFSSSGDPVWTRHDPPERRARAKGRPRSWRPKLQGQTRQETQIAKRLDYVPLGAHPLSALS